MPCCGAAILPRMIVLALLLLVGFLLASHFDSRDPVERGAFVLLGALVAAPLLAVSVAWIAEVRLTPSLVAVAAATVALAAAPSWWANRGEGAEPWTARHTAVLLGALAVAAVTWANHNDAELLLSLTSYLQRGEAECFYMQSFALTDELQGAGNTASVRDAWSIISVPTNVIFTAPLLPLLDDVTFRAVDALARALLFTFLACLVYRREGSVLVALGVSAFALLNPYTLGVEVLDRNVLCAMLSAALLLSLRTAPSSALLHGALLGLTAGAGLRFLPIVFALPVLLHHGRDLRRALPRLGAGFALTVAVGVPHLAQHGLHSLGETESLPGLLALALTQLPRAPFAPYPAGALHALEVLSRLGVVVVGAGIGGAWVLWRRDRRDAVGLVVPIIAAMAVLAVQRDWLQWDKLRIPLMLVVPAAVLLARQAAALVEDRRAAGAWGVGTVLAGVTALGLSSLDTPPDTSTYTRHPLYATETPQRILPAQEALRPGLFPDARRLATKAEWGRKRRQGLVLRAALFPAGSPTGDVAAAAGWDVGNPLLNPPASDDSVTIAIDLSLLLTDPQGSVSPAPGEQPWVNATAPDLLDIYHRGVSVPWQPEELNVTVLPLGAESQALGELVVELDAFAGDGLAPDGMRRVVPVHRTGRNDRGPGVLRAVPQVTDSPRVVLRVPVGRRIVVRHWLIDLASGSPHRVDSWLIGTADGVSVRYALGEPESYL